MNYASAASACAKDSAFLAKLDHCLLLLHRSGVDVQSWRAGPSVGELLGPAPGASRGSVSWADVAPHFRMSYHSCFGERVMNHNGPCCLLKLMEAACSSDEPDPVLMVFVPCPPNS